MDPAVRTLRARLGAHVMWANTPDRQSRTAAARAAAAGRFEQIAAVADQLKRAHYTRMQLASAKSRAKKAGKPAAA